MNNLLAGFFIFAAFVLGLALSQLENDAEIEAKYYKTLAECLAEAYELREEFAGDIEIIVKSCGDYAYTAATGSDERSNMAGGL